jgi:hypothetical protein
LFHAFCLLPSKEEECACRYSVASCNMDSAYIAASLEAKHIDEYNVLPPTHITCC